MRIDDRFKIAKLEYINKYTKGKTVITFLPCLRCTKSDRIEIE